ncbi:MAG TPA: MFS transporter [Stellaceae bacterium]|nr:MFS transporter [Stellaceae bacterium]
MLQTGIFRSKWWMVAAALVALTANTGVIQGFSLSVFVVPITKDLGITRGELFGAPIFGSIFFLLVVTPLFGKALDRYGLRRVHMLMIAGYAIGTMCLAFLRLPYYAIVLLFSFQQLFGSGQSPIAYTKAIAAWFDKDRGLALGIAIAGVGLGVAIIPPYDTYIIEHYGWRAAFVGMGVAILVLALIPVFLFEREPPIPPERERPKNDTSIPGYLWRQAVLHDWRFAAMTVAFFLAPIAINGTITQIVPMLLDRHVPLAVAVGALSASGVALTGGRILSGYCLDKIHGPYVAAFFFAASGVGIALLAAGYSPFLGVVLCGMGVGGEVDLMAFLVSRYFGLRCFGAIYASMFGLFSLGVVLGPFFLGLSHDKFGSYEPMMLLNIAFIVVICLLLIGLGPYRFAVRKDTGAPAVASAPAE